jgi:hypothetical protein
VDTDTAVRFLRDLHTTSPRDAWLSGWCIDHDTGRKNTVWSTVGEPEVLIDQLAALPGRLSIFVGVAPRSTPLPEGARGGASDCVGVPCLWVDIDVYGPNHKSSLLPRSLDDALRSLEKYPEEPSLLVETGGGIQAYWTFDEFMPTGPALDRLLARWNAWWTTLFTEEGWKIDNVWDVARVMRLPGSLNNKQINAPIPVVLR